MEQYNCSTYVHMCSLVATNDDSALWLIEESKLKNMKRKVTFLMKTCQWINLSGCKDNDVQFVQLISATQTYHLATIISNHILDQWCTCYSYKTYPALPHHKQLSIPVLISWCGSRNIRDKSMVRGDLRISEYIQSLEGGWEDVEEVICIFSELKFVNFTISSEVPNIYWTSEPVSDVSDEPLTCPRLRGCHHGGQYCGMVTGWQKLARVRCLLQGWRRGGGDIDFYKSTFPGAGR